MRAAVFVLLFLGILLPLALTGSAAEGKGGPQPSGPTAQSVLLGGIRSLNGLVNNPLRPKLGSAGQPYLRTARADYGDGVSTMADGPDARYVSNRVFNDTGQNIFSENGVTQWAWTWGQFLDHTFGLRQAGTESAPIPYDAGDPLESFENDLGVIDFARSAAAPGTGTGFKNPRQQVNTESSYIDAWAVYGGTNERLEWLREGPVDGNLANNGPHLLLTADGYLPQVSARGNAATAPSMELMGQLMGNPSDAIVAGDVRANENIALTAVQTLFAREHNRIVDALPASLPSELRFQIARAVVIAEEQYVTYNEFLPSLGVKLDKYRGYNWRVDPTLSNEFATAAYRAHSMIHGEFEIEAEADAYTPEQVGAFEAMGMEVEPDGADVELVVPLSVAFGNPDLVSQIGLGQVLAGLGAESQYKNDEQMDNQLRSVLFQLPGPGITDPSECLNDQNLPDCFSVVQDLGAIDIQRGRDHGIATYNDLRKAYGLPPAMSFKQITGESTESFPNDPEIDPGDPINDPDILDFVLLKDANGNVLPPGTEEGAVVGVRRTTLAARLKAVYGNVNNLDAFVGLMAEKHVPGTEFGPLQLAIWKKQFTALRDGDRYFYANYPALAKIQSTFGISYQHSLAEIIAMNSDVDPGDLHSNVFKLSSPMLAINITSGPGSGAPSLPAGSVAAVAALPGAGFEAAPRKERASGV
jgi:hypothetical protein